MRLLFMGTGDFALPSFTTLLDSRHSLIGLVTQPDKPAGRGHKIRMPATKTLALDEGVPVHQPARIRKAENVALIEQLNPDCIVLVAYGQIIPQSILDIPPKGIINVHGSLLPRYRGAAPIQWAIANCDTETGVTTMLMDAGLDTGPELLKATCPITIDDTAATLTAKLAPLGAELLLRTLDEWEDGRLTPTPQDDDLATKAPMIQKEDGRIDWSLSAREIHCRVRAFDPWPSTFTSLGERPIKVWKASVENSVEAAPDLVATTGQIISVDKQGVTVRCGGETNLRLLEVQPAGRPRMSAADFARGGAIAVGDQLGPRPHFS